MSEKEKVLAKLDELKIEYKLITHEAVHTMEDLENLGIFTEGEPCKNLFLRNANGKVHYVVSMLKDKHPDIQGSLKAQLSSSRLSFGSEARLMEHLGLHKGEVTPLGVINDKDHSVKVVLDSDLKKIDGLIGFHPNDCTAFVWLRLEDLLKYISHFGNEIIFVEI